MKVSLLTSCASRKAGGLFATIPNLSKSLNQLGITVNVVCVEDKYLEDDKYVYENIPLIIYHKSRWPLFAQLGYSNDIKDAIKNSMFNIIHQQGIWLYHSCVALRYKQKYPNTVKIIEPHGMLDKWAIKNSAWKKKIAGWLFEYKNLHTADCIHALCEEEYKSIRSIGLRNPIAIIPNGVDLPQNPHFNRGNKQKILLYLGRIHPKKGLKEMILGFAQLKQSSPELLNKWCVRIAGWGQNKYVHKLQNLINKYRLNNNITFIGPVYGSDKDKELCNANAFILPSYSEGLPISVLEAWAYQLPVIMTDFCNLPEGFNVNAAVRINPTPQSICEGLMNFFVKDDNDIEVMGKNGFKLVSEQFTWQHIAKQTLELYLYLLGNGEKPNFVYE